MYSPTQGADRATSSETRVIVYVSKRHREGRVVDRLREHAQRVERSPSAVIMAACEELLARHGAESETREPRAA